MKKNRKLSPEDKSELAEFLVECMNNAKKHGWKVVRNTTFSLNTMRCCAMGATLINEDGGIDCLGICCHDSMIKRISERTGLTVQDVSDIANGFDIESKHFVLRLDPEKRQPEDGLLSLGVVLSAEFVDER